MTSLAPQAYVLIIALAVMGGAIAWAGDAIGYRLGKMRVSIFGLRPRKTARVIGAVSGVLIACLTITVLAMTVKDVRTFLFRIDEIQQELTDAREELRETRSELARAKEGARGAQERARNLTASVRDLAQQNAVQSRKNRQLQRQSERLAKEVTIAKRQVHASHRHVAAAQAELREVSEDLKTLYRIRDELGESLEVSVQRPPAFVVNELLATRVVRSGRPQAAIAAELVKLLFAASDVAERHGAKIGDNGRAVRVVRLQAEQTGRGSRVRKIQEKERIRDVSAWLAAQPPAEYVVGVYAAKNIFPDTQGLVDLAWTPNELLLRRGEILLTVPVDGALPESRIYETVSEMVYRRLRLIAQEAGVLPQPETNTYGRFEPPELLFEVTRLLKKRGTITAVRVVVTEDCWTIGPLKVTLELGAEVSP